MMIPIDILLLPNYLTVSKMGLINTYLGMMIVFFTSALYIFMMRQAFLSYSKSLKEAAHIDGCSNFRFYWNILLPSSLPIGITIFISSFVAVWNTYIWPMLVTNRNEMRTIQVAITMLNFPDESPHGPVMAAAVLILLPSVLVFLFCQRWIKAGMTAGSIKG
jgi:sn-glycerol 3-phosphate transport system permease protein